MSSSSRSSSLILSVSEGIRVLASSAVSQHKEPEALCMSKMTFSSTLLLVRAERQRLTQLCPFELLHILVCAEQTLNGFDILFLAESCKVIEVGKSVVKDTTGLSKHGQPSCCFKTTQPSRHIRCRASNIIDDRCCLSEYPFKGGSRTQCRSHPCDHSVASPSGHLEPAQLLSM